MSTDLFYATSGLTGVPTDDADPLLTRLVTDRVLQALSVGALLPPWSVLVSLRHLYYLINGSSYRSLQDGYLFSCTIGTQFTSSRQLPFWWEQFI